MLKTGDPEGATRRRARAAQAVGVVLALLIVLESAAGAYATTDSNAATEPLRVYLDTILRPALEGTVPPDEVLHAFYASHLATETRA